MIKFKKYVIIMCIVGAISILHSFNVFASEDVVGPGQNLESGAEWLVDAYSNLGSPELWAGWTPIRFGTGIDARLKPGDMSHSDIIYTDRRIGKIQGAGAAKGYGIYQILLEKHMVGYLYYIKNKVATKKKMINSEGNEEEETLTVSLDGVSHQTREACEYVANKLMSSAYSVADRNLLHILLDTIVIQNKAEDIKDWQTDYWYKVFGNKAYNLLYNKDDGGLGASDIASGHEKELRGVILSIMSDRYMNKSLMNKTNLELKIKKGDLWPFLVYTTTYNNGITTLWEYEDYKVGKDGKKQKKKTTWDDLIRGAYYYMVYYEYKYDYEGDIELDEDVIYNSTKADQFVQEYQALTGKAFVELTGAELDDFYQKIRTIRRIYKKSDENGALFGEEEDYSINSDITYYQAMNNIERKMQTQPFKDLFDHTLGDDYIARTYLMAKNIAENHRLTNQNAQYDIGSNILQRTPGGRDHTVLLTDLQKIQLKATAFGFTDDADKDGILDGNEMGTYKQVDITKFVEHMLKAESGLSDVSALMENYRNNIRAANADPHKQNLVESQKDIDVDFWGNIKVMLMSYTSNPILKDTDFDGIDDGFGYQDKECTTFVNKNASNDQTPRDNKFDGEITMSNGNNFAVNTHMDYRYFFLDEYNYYDELAEMSLILSQSVYNRSNANLTSINSIKEKIGLEAFKYGTGNTGTIDDIISPYINETINGVKYETNYAVGFKAIRYSKNNSAFNSSYIKKLVIPIVIPGMTEISDAKSYSEIGKAKWASEDSIKSKLVDPESHNVKSYEIYANLIKSSLSLYGLFHNNEKYVNYIADGYKPVYWVTGYKEGGAIANILAAKLRDEGKSVYAYTFGAPMTIYNNPDEPGYTKTGYSARYDCIFNVVNEDDAYAYMMPQELGFSRYGKTCFGEGSKLMGSNYIGTKTSKETIVSGINKVYEGKEKDTRNKTYEPKSIYRNLQNVINRMINAIDINRNHKEPTAINDNNVDTIEEFYTRYRNVKTSNLSTFITALESKTDGINTNYNRVKRAGQEDVYYKIAENMDNADITNVVNFHDKKEHRLRVATGSDLYGRYPNYHALSPHNIDINNPVPSIFQDAEVWSQFRYGTQYTEGINNTIAHPNDADKEESERRNVRIYNDDFYPYGTFWESGCGATAPAIVLSYIFDKQITPMDVRDKLENDTNDYRPYKNLTYEELVALPKNKRVSGTNHDSERRIAELYGLSCEHFTQNTKDKNKEYEASIKVAKHLLRGNPVIALSHNGVFTFGGHFIVIAGIDTNQVNDLKRQKGVATLSEPEKTTRWNQVIDTLSYDDLKDLRIYVLDPRYRHEERPTERTQRKVATITTSWSIETFKHGGTGNVDNFWVYTKNNTTNVNSIVESELFDFNKTKYPDDYKEYFDPQEPSDADSDCNSDMSDKPIGFYGKMRQYWKERLGITSN